jgi:uncharacterized membrane protein
MRGRTVVVGVCAVAYVVACHWLMTGAPTSFWNAVVLVGPMLALLGVYAWQRRQRAIASLCALGLVGLLAQAWRGGGVAPTILYMVQHVAIHLGLAALFAMTLRSGQESLITALARRVHGSLTPSMEAYSRRVTLAWAVYFVTMAVVSVGLFMATPFEVWAAFANFGTPLGVALLFVGEYLLRYRLHPEFERATLSAAMHAFSRRDLSP